MKYKTFTKSRCLIMAARGVNMSGNEGMRQIVEAVARKLHKFPPSTKKQRWELLAEFAEMISAASISLLPTVTPGDVNHPSFLQSYEWRKLRMQAIEKYGRRCQCCGATPDDGVTKIHVDHIKPRRKYPHLALKLENLQVLCDVCNHGKGNWSETDWRSEHAIDPNAPCWTPYVTPWKRTK